MLVYSSVDSGSNAVEASCGGCGDGCGGGVNAVVDISVDIGW